MKKVFKLGCLGIIGFIVLGVILAAFAGGEGDTSIQEQKTPESANVKESAPEKEDDNKVTLENYEKVIVGDSLTGDGGMTIEEVTAIFGAGPENIAESQSGDLKMVVGSWTATGWENIGDNVSVTFINGKASTKAQFGLDD